jgi:hypothetical protein
MRKISRLYYIDYDKNFENFDPIFKELTNRYDKKVLSKIHKPFFIHIIELVFDQIYPKYHLLKT